MTAALHGRSFLQLLADVAWRSGRGGSRVLQRRLLGRRFVERRVHDYHLLLDADDPGISRQLLDRGSREPEQQFLVERILQPGSVALDLGANLGYYTVMMARRVGAHGKVCAVEPFPRSFELLRHNVRLNQLDNVLLENVAIGACDGEQSLLLSEKSNWHSLHAPRTDPDIAWQAKYSRKLVGALPVRTLSLSTYLRDKPAIDLLRMDLEGYETEILRAVATLPSASTNRLRILFETHPEFYDAHTCDMRGSLEQLCRRGFVFEWLVSDFHHGSRADARLEPGCAVFEKRGYGTAHIVRQFRNRAIYSGVSWRDAIDLVCTSECVHAAVLAAPYCGRFAYE